MSGLVQLPAKRSCLAGGACRPSWTVLDILGPHWEVAGCLPDAPAEVAVLAVGPPRVPDLDLWRNPVQLQVIGDDHEAELAGFERQRIPLSLDAAAQGPAMVRHDALCAVSVAHFDETDMPRGVD